MSKSPASRICSLSRRRAAHVLSPPGHFPGRNVRPQIWTGAFEHLIIQVAAHRLKVYLVVVAFVRGIVRPDGCAIEINPEKDKVRIGNVDGNEEMLKIEENVYSRLYAELSN